LQTINRKAFLGERLEEVFQSEMEPNSCSRFRQKLVPIEALYESQRDKKTSNSRKSFLHKDEADLTVIGVEVMSLVAQGFWEGVDSNNSNTFIVFECFLD
jgi:hypothetical protein